MTATNVHHRFMTVRLLPVREEFDRRVHRTEPCKSCGVELSRVEVANHNEQTPNMAELGWRRTFWEQPHGREHTPTRCAGIRTTNTRP